MIILILDKYCFCQLNGRKLFYKKSSLQGLKKRLVTNTVE